MENISLIFLVVLITLALWDLVWKAFGLWKAARNGQIKWFIAILIVNSVGILPIIYLQFFQKSPKSREGEKSDTAQMAEEEKGAENNSFSTTH